MSFQPWHIKATDALIFSPLLLLHLFHIWLRMWIFLSGQGAPGLSIQHSAALQLKLAAEFPRKLGLGSCWCSAGAVLVLVLCWCSVLVGGGLVARLVKTKLAIRFNAKETVGSHQCWCELVQRKTGIKVMSSGSIYAESIHFLGKHTFTWRLRWHCKTRQLARWC